MNQSLILRAGLAMGLITVLALGGMASAVFVARSTHGEAAAVNQAGSLRMQSYRIAAALEAGRSRESAPFGDLMSLTREFEQRLTSGRLTDVVAASSRKSIHKAYRLITDRWRQTVLPLIQACVEASSDPEAAASIEANRRAFVGTIGGVVADIDDLVRLLEEDADSRIHLLGLFQGISLFLTLAVAIATLYLLQTDVLGPLHDMLHAAERAGNGDFTARVSQTGEDELGRLGRTLNSMTEDLSRMYGVLEERVAEKTRELTQRNKSLELLYSATQSLTRTPVAETTYRELLEEIKQVVAAGGITLCLKEDETNQTRLLVRIGPAPPMCRKDNCVLCLGDGRRLVSDGPAHGGGRDFLSVPVGDQKHNNGVLVVEIMRDRPLESWQIQLLETLGKHIGISVEASRRVTQGRRLALLEERGVMARELHDSLAQSLTYLRIQVTRLSMLMRSGAGPGAVDDALGELKQGLDAAYRQLRELLTTFRLQMDGGGLGPALAKTVDEFDARGKLEILLDNRLGISLLTVNEEIHLLQIVREALSNVIQHSRATRARVSLAQAGDGSISVSVEDNGSGTSRQTGDTHHFGLAIMRERAKSMHGDLRIEPGDGGGTRVYLEFQPSTSRRSRLSAREEKAI